MTVTVFAFGGHPSECGGYSVHNPFRQFIENKFRRLLATLPDAEIVIGLASGVGQWLAESVPDGRQYSSWHSTKAKGSSSWKHLLPLIERGGGVSECCASNGLLRPCLEQAAYQLAHNYQRVILFAGSAAPLVFDPSLTQEKTLQIINITMQDMPPAFIAAAAMEEVRAHIPQGLISAITKARQTIINLSADENTTDIKLLLKLRSRYEQLDELQQLLEKVQTRE